MFKMLGRAKGEEVKMRDLRDTERELERKSKVNHTDSTTTKGT